MASTITADNGVSSGSAGLKSSADSSGVLALASGTGTTAVTIDASQNVGIGVVPSTISAGVKAIQIGTGSADGFFYGLGGNDTEVTTNAYFNSGYKYQTTGIAATRYFQSGGIHAWAYAPSGTTGNAITFTEAMRIDTSGNVGIGTNTPDYQLDVSGTSTSTTTLGVGISVENLSFTTNTRAGIVFRNGDNYGSSIWSPRTGSSAGALVFGTNNAAGTAETNIVERARIDSSGNLLVGSTSATMKVYVEQAADQYGMGIRCTNASFTSNCLFVAADRNTTNGTFYPINYYNYGTSTYRFRVADSGNVTNTNNSYGAISDIKLKENITDATPKLAQLNQVRVVNYNFIGNDAKQLGVIAQELEQIFPAMVDESPDRDADGNDLGTTTKSVKYSVFVPMLIKAIQEQQTLITSLTARIAALEGAQQ